MKGALLAWALMQAGSPSSQVIELPDPAVQEVTFQAVIQLPRLTAEERGTLAAVVRAMPRGTEQYTTRNIRVATDGRPVICDLMPDHVRVGVTVPRENFTAGLGVLENLIHRPRLSPEDIASSTAQEADAWQRALHPLIYPEPRLTPERLRLIRAKVFRPENITLAVSGGFANGTAEREWHARTSKWQLPRTTSFRDDYSEAKPRPSGSDAVRSIELQSLAAPHPATLLALFALGSGKGSSLFQSVRNELGVSYRQESILWPTTNGFVARILLLTTQPVEPDAVRDQLNKSVEAWTDSDRLRALGIAEAVIVRGLPFSPFYFTQDRPIDDSLEDQTFMHAYWLMKTGERWEPRALLDSMSKTSLPVLQTAARDLLSKP